MNEKHRPYMIEMLSKEKLDGEIVAANYGIDDNNRTDVLEKVKAKFNGSIMLDIPNYNDEFGDVCPNKVKNLRIMVRYKDGTEKHFRFNENQPVLLTR